MASSPKCLHSIRFISFIMLAAVCLPLFVFPSPAQAAWGPDVQISSSSTNADGATVAVSGNYVHTSWQQSNGNDSDIYYRRSADGGATWDLITHLVINPSDSLNAHIAASGSYVHIIWVDDRDGQSEVYYKRSTDNGANWGPDTRLSDLPDRSFNISIAVSGSNIHVVWQDQRDGNREIYYKRSTDNGATWGPDIRLTTDGGASQEPSVAASGNNVYVAWEDTRTGDYNVYFKYSTDNGANWSIDRQMTTDTNTQWYCSIAAAGNYVYLVWDDDRSGDKDIYYRHSANGGVNWSPETRMTTDPSDQHQVKIAASGNNAMMIWTDERDPGSSAIYYRQCSDGGLFWRPEALLSSDLFRAEYPCPCLAGDTVHVTWSDGRTGNYEAYYKRSPALGGVGNLRTGQVMTDNGPVNFSIDNGAFTSLAGVPRADTPCLPANYFYPFGLFSFTIGNLTPGQAVRVTITFPSILGGGFKYIKCNGRAVVDCSSLASRLDDRTIVLTLTDGGPGDLDGAANGIIVDPGGPALPLSSPQSSSAQMPATKPQKPVSLSNITVKSASLSAGNVAPGTPVTVTASVANTGTGNGTSMITVFINGEQEAQQGVTVNSGGVSTVTFDISRNEPGTYTVYVGGVQAGSFTVDQFTPDNILFISGALVFFSLILGTIWITRRKI